MVRVRSAADRNCHVGEVLLAVGHVTVVEVPPSASLSGIHTAGSGKHVRRINHEFIILKCEKVSPERRRWGN